MAQVPQFNWRTGRTISHLAHVPNDTVTGTVQWHLASPTNDNPVHVIHTAAGQGNAFGICVDNCGTSGDAIISCIGQSKCEFDGATTANHFVQISTTQAGMCTDVGSVRPTSGKIVGRVMTTNASAGIYDVILFGIGVQGGVQVNATKDHTGLSASLPSTTLFTNGPNSDVHEISWYLVVTQAGNGGTVKVNIDWNDGIVAQSFSSSTVMLNGVGNAISGNLPVSVGVSQIISHSTTVAGGSGSPLYDLRLRARQL